MNKLVFAVAVAVAAVAFSSNARDMPIYGGRLTSDMDAGGFSIRGLASPSDGGDAANKSYVDLKSSGVDTNAVIDVIHDTVDGAARPLPRYLHALEFDDSYPDAAVEYYRSRGDGKVDGGCSAVRDGGFLFRNFDFPFDERAEFVVRMSAGKDRFASVGVAQVGTNLTEEIVTSGKPNRWYKALPGATVDGINENGVVAEINVVDGYPQASGWHNDTGDLHPLAAVRWTLDTATNAQHAAEYLASHIAFPSGWTQNFHYMVADAEQTWIVENGVASNVTAVAAKRVVTNFEILPDTYSGMGVERYQLLRGGNNITNAWYTRAYHRETNPPWVSDLAEVLAYTNEIFNAWEENPKEHFRGQLNGGKPWWQTVHTSVYDITNRVLRVAVQETDDWYVFALRTGGGNVDLSGKRDIDDFNVYGMVPGTNWVASGGGVERFGDLWVRIDDTQSQPRRYSYVLLSGPEVVLAFGYAASDKLLSVVCDDYNPYFLDGPVTCTRSLVPGVVDRIATTNGTVTIGPSQGIVDLTTYQGLDAVVFGAASRFTRIGGSSIDLFGGSTYVNGDLKPNRSVQMTPEQFRFTNRGNMNLIELIESYIHANDGSGLSVTDPSYSFANQARTATLSAPHIPTEDNPVVTSQGTLTYDGTNYWLNGETQYDRDVDGDVKASVTLDQQNLTNVVTAVKSYHYDETLGVTWKMVPDDGHIYLIAVTNANVVTQ